MFMFKMTSNFYPADEPKNGYIGKADLTIAEAIKINGISVFNNNGVIGMRLPEYERRDNGAREEMYQSFIAAFGMCRIKENYLNNKIERARSNQTDNKKIANKEDLENKCKSNSKLITGEK